MDTMTTRKQYLDKLGRADLERIARQLGIARIQHYNLAGLRREIRRIETCRRGTN